MAALNFNAANVAPDTGIADPVPAGWYVAMVTESDIKPTSNGNGARLAVTYTIQEPQKYAGRKVFGGFNIKNDNPVAQDIAFKQLSALAHAVGVLQVEDSQQLHGIPFKVRIKVKPAQGQYEASNEPTAYRNMAEDVKLGPANPEQASSAPSGGMQAPAGFGGMQAPAGFGGGMQQPQMQGFNQQQAPVQQQQQMQQQMQQQPIQQMQQQPVQQQMQQPVQPQQMQQQQPWAQPGNTQPWDQNGQQGGQVQQQQPQQQMQQQPQQMQQAQQPVQQMQQQPMDQQQGMQQQMIQQQPVQQQVQQQAPVQQQQMGQDPAQIAQQATPPWMTQGQQAQ